MDRVALGEIENLAVRADIGGALAVEGGAGAGAAPRMRAAVPAARILLPICLIAPSSLLLRLHDRRTVEAPFFALIQGGFLRGSSNGARIEPANRRFRRRATRARATAVPAVDSRRERQNNHGRLLAFAVRALCVVPALLCEGGLV
jgi:hypothetical protein